MCGIRCEGREGSWHLALRECKGEAFWSPKPSMLEDLFRDAVRKAGGTRERSVPAPRCTAIPSAWTTLRPPPPSREWAGGPGLPEDHRLDAQVVQEGGEVLGHVGLDAGHDDRLVAVTVNGHPQAPQPVQQAAEARGVEVQEDPALLVVLEALPTPA